MKYQTVMAAEVKVDCYSGDNFDQQHKYFDMYCDGDMEGGPAISDQIIIDLASLPAGARLSVEYPCCPECGEARGDSMQFKDGVWEIIGHHDKCGCGFDWVKWAQDEYS